MPDHRTVTARKAPGGMVTPYAACAAIASPGGVGDGDGQQSAAAAPLLGIAAALGRIAGRIEPVPRTEAILPGHAMGRVLAAEVRAQSSTPPFDNAAMDGYAMMSAALAGDGPWSLPVVARVAAGQVCAEPLVGAQAARIFTGAPMPAGADTVVAQEDVTRDGDTIRLLARPASGAHVRRAGSDMAAGVVVLDRGCRLGPRQIAACAAAGSDRITVRARVRVALLVTGDEVAQAGTPRATGQIWDVNTPMLAAGLSGPTVMLVAVERSADNRDGLARQIAELAACADLVVTSGGLSVGEEDHVRAAFGAAGGAMLFSGVAIKPGKPVSVGRIGAAAWLGLPGNPLSAFVTWQVFGTAVIRALAGEIGTGPRRRIVVTAEEIRRKGGRCELRLARLDGRDAHGRDVACFEAATHSGQVAGLSAADGLIVLPPDACTLPAGSMVEFVPLSDG